MNDWRSDFLDAANHAIEELEDWAGEWSLGAAKQFDRLVEFTAEWSDEVATDVTDAVADVMTHVTTELSAQTQAFLDTDLDSFLNTLLHPLTVESLEDWINAVSVPNQSSGVAIKPHPLCVNCKNFHGQAYNDVSLVCGIHP